MGKGYKNIGYRKGNINYVFIDETILILFLREKEININ